MKNRASEVLNQKAKVIMVLWEERARREVSSSYGAASLTLRNALPGHLEQLSEALGSSGEKSIEEIANITVREKDIGKQHGKDRAKHSNYSINEVILEYRILRQIIIQVLEKEIMLSGKERDIITDLLEQAVNDAASEFSHSLREVNDHYTAILSHDLRGPLTKAKTSAQLILRSPETSEACTRNAGRIVECLDRMNSMLENLLDAGRIRVGQGLPTTWTECIPAELVQTVVDEMITIYGPYFQLKSDLKQGAWWSCDLIRRALENLMTNAVKYGDPKSQVKVSLELQGSFFMIAVHNRGNPIPKDEMAKLFQHYHRAKSAVESNKKGWGLGLTLVSGAVQAHGGQIEVESSEVEGTIFKMILPADCRSLNRNPDVELKDF